jgi:hypothetical protein
MYRQPRSAAFFLMAQQTALDASRMNLDAEMLARKGGRDEIPHP